MTEEVKITVTPEEHADPFHDKHDSKGYRKNEKWSQAHEELLVKWRESSTKAAEEHNKSAKVNKSKHVIFGLPAILIPIVLSPVSIALDGNGALPYVSMVGFVTSGLFSAIHTFFDYSGKTQRHFDFEARYSDVVSTIDFELSKSRQYRRDSDEFLMDIQKTFDYLGSSAPDL